MLPEFEAAGATLFAITPQKTEKSAEQIEERKLKFPLLRDEGNAFAHALGLRHELPADLREVYKSFGIDLPASNGEGSWTLPLPARYVVNRAGIVVAAQVDADYTKRPEPAETLTVVRALSS